MSVTQNILLFIILVLFFINFQFIISTFVLFFWELRDVIIKNINREEIDKSIEEIIVPNEAILRKQGFVYQSSMEYQSILTRFDTLHHINYYYNEALDLHAFIETTPIAGFLTSSIINYVTFYESYKRSISFDCFEYNIFASEEVYLFDHYYGDYDNALTSHLTDREMEGEVIVKGSLSVEGAKDFKQYFIDEQLAEMLNRNIIKRSDKGYRYAASWAYIKYVYKSLKMNKIAKKIYASNSIEQENSMSENEIIRYQTTEERTLLTYLEQKPKGKSKEEKVKTFITSALLFVLFFGLIGIPWQSLPIIITILLIHELGHYLAMRYYGYKDTSIFFIPLFGAAAKGEKEHTKPFEEYMVFLAGPLPGIIISLILGFFILKEPSLAENSIYKEFAIISFAINFINLLPIYPLDGGRIVQTLIFSRYPKAQFYFFLLSLTIIIVSAFLFKSIILGFFALVLFLSINHNYNLALLLKNLKDTQSNEPLKKKIITHITKSSRFKKLSIVEKTLLAKQALKFLNLEVPSKLLMFLGMFFYLFLILMPFLVLVIVKLLLH